MTKPTIVIPMHDPTGVMFSHLRTITPRLKAIFSQAFVSVPVATYQALPAQMAWLAADDFFQASYHQDEVSIGEEFLALYQNAANNCRPDQILHLCFIDRLAFALQTHHRSAFVADIQTATLEHTPLLFHRSSAAWDTHPQNYRELEHWITRAGELLFGKTLDFAWCHLALQAQQLQQALPLIQSRDMSVLAELILLMRDEMQTKDVDWLAWEDPFILARDAHTIKTEREQNPQEARKRLSYVLPMLQRLNSAAKNASSCPN